MPIEGESTGCRQWNEFGNLLRLSAERRASQPCDSETVNARYRRSATSFIFGLRDIVVFDHDHSQQP